MSAPILCLITPTRIAWLQYLAKHGRTSWSRMPKRRNGLGAVTNQTWRPMVAAGLIEAKFYSPTFRDPLDHYFTITEAGCTAIVEATGAAS